MGETGKDQVTVIGYPKCYYKPKYRGAIRAGRKLPKNGGISGAGDISWAESGKTMEPSLIEYFSSGSEEEQGDRREEWSPREAGMKGRGASRAGGRGIRWRALEHGLQLCSKPG